MPTCTLALWVTLGYGLAFCVYGLRSPLVVQAEVERGRQAHVQVEAQRGQVEQEQTPGKPAPPTQALSTLATLYMHLLASIPATVVYNVHLRYATGPMQHRLCLSACAHQLMLMWRW